MAPNPRPERLSSLSAPRFDSPAALQPTFPTAALGPLLAPAITAVAAQTQAPLDLVAHHILTLAAMAAQRLISIRLPTGAQRPVSCFFASLVGTGEGRSAAEKTIVDTARLWERGFEDAFPMRVAAHIDEGVDTGVQRPAPLQHLNLFYDPRAPQVDDRYRAYARQSGLFARHPHDLIQPGRPRRDEAASLCALWNGRVFQRAAGPTLFPRLSLHLTATPRAGRALLSDPELADIGLLGRLLVAVPPSRIGARTFMLAESDEPHPAFNTLLAYLAELYEQHPCTETRVVTFSKGAAAAWLCYVQEVEAALAPGAVFASMRPFAGHLPEHAARLAAVCAFMNDCAFAEITETHLETGIALARFYADVRLDIQSEAAPMLSEQEKEELLRDWLQRTQSEKDVTLRDVCRTGPKMIRDADTAYKLMRRMERLGIVQPANAAFSGAAASRRTLSRHTWRVEKEADQSVA